MRDLYKDLSLTWVASESQIRERISALAPLNGVLAARAEFVLLDKKRRLVYDRTHRVLRQIAYLRSHAALGSIGFGKRREFDHFRLDDKNVPRISQSREQWTNVPPWLALAVIGVCVGIAYWVVVQSVPIPLRAPWSSPNPVANEGAGPESGLRLVEDPQSELSPASGRVPSSNPSGSSESHGAPKREPVLVALPLPKTGAFITSKSSTQTSIKVRTSKGGANVLVKIEAESGKEVTRVFIREGESYTIPLPLGTYILKTASGTQWYGAKERFGPRTTYSQADDTFPLNERGEQWEVQLIPQSNGNLSTKPLQAEEF